MNNIYNFTSFLLVIVFSFSCSQQKPVSIDGELKKWHRITLSFEGPETSEIAENNPFLNYRLEVTFTNGEEKFIVPGFYAADGNAANTSSNFGNIWQVRFTPNKTGEWLYKVSFKTGENIAVSDASLNAESAGYFDGVEGSFSIEESDKVGKDNRAKGKLQYIGESYLRFAESNQYFIKLGVDAPENLLAYADFDASTNALGLQKKWEPHANDFEKAATSFLWGENKGKNLLGAINYLSNESLNVFSFLTFNIDGDDRNVFPHLLKVSIKEYEKYASVKKNKEAWQTLFHKTRFDVSKLDQWERIFEYAEIKGMFLHFKTHETETDHLMDNGVFGIEGKLYYRELIARFGHHLAMNWNLGEENDQPIEEVKKVADYVYHLDPYKSHLVIHTYPQQDHRYQHFIGSQTPMTGASLQLGHETFDDVHPRVLKWRKKSNATGKKWAIAVDEPGKAKIALLPDTEDSEHNYARGRAMYGTLFAGGFGVEWYFGYASPNSDLTCQDFRSRDLFWKQNKHALQFFNNDLPFWQMEPKDELITSKSIAYCLAKEHEVYAIYAEENSDEISINLGNSKKTYTISWFDPRNGGKLQKGSKTSVRANGIMTLGNPPKELDKDWLILIQAKK